MRDERLDELLWERIDGAIADEDRQWLEAQLERRAEVRAREQELLEVAAALKRIEQLEAPADLRARIDSAIASVGDAQRRSTSSKVVLREYRHRGWRVRYMYLAAGLLIGSVAAILLTGGRPADPMVFSGTMGVHRGRQVTAVKTIDLGVSRGRLTLGVDEEALVTDLRLDAESHAELVVFSEAWNPRLDSVEGGASTSSRVWVEGDSIVSVVAGPARTVLTSSRPEPGREVRVKVVVGGSLLVEEVVVLED